MASISKGNTEVALLDLTVGYNIQYINLLAKRAKMLPWWVIIALEVMLQGRQFSDAS